MSDKLPQKTAFTALELLRDHPRTWELILIIEYFFKSGSYKGISRDDFLDEFVRADEGCVWQGHGDRPKLVLKIFNIQYKTVSVWIKIEIVIHFLLSLFENNNILTSIIKSY